jgi:hypothetical protein
VPLLSSMNPIKSAAFSCTYAELSEAARNGCFTCKVLLEGCPSAIDYPNGSKVNVRRETHGIALEIWDKGWNEFSGVYFSKFPTGTL